jgi:hypothetical protein
MTEMGRMPSSRSCSRLDTSSNISSRTSRPMATQNRHQSADLAFLILPHLQSMTLLQRSACLGATIRWSLIGQHDACPSAVSETPKSLYASSETRPPLIDGSGINGSALAADSSSAGDRSLVHLEGLALTHQGAAGCENDQLGQLVL